MAIYKPTDCSPYGGYLNFATIPTGDDRVIYIECKIHTDNKQVTGYRLVLCDAENNIIWDPQYISPVSKLKEIDYGPRSNEDHGDGINGSTLLIPFVQGARGTEYALSRVINKSPNCLYTDIHRQVDYFVGQLTTAQQTYAYITSLDELSDWNINAVAGDQGFVGAQILFYDLDANVYKIMILNKDVPVLPIVVPLNNIISIKFGVQYHGTVLKLDTEPAPSIYTDWLMYLDNYNSTSQSVDYNVLSLKIDTEYAWKIFLYQGDIQINPTPDGAEDSNLDQINNMPSATSLNDRHEKFYYGTYPQAYDVNQYDILIGEGQIMGSNGARLQIKPTDVVLQKKWVQLGVATIENEVLETWEPWGNRALIDVYSSSTGYIFPTQNSFEENILQNTDINACCIYAYSNNTEEVSPKDIVRLATTSDLTPQEISHYVYQLFSGDNIYPIDGALPQSGDLILLKDLVGYEYLHGVYYVNNGISWRRSGMYNNYGSLLNKVFLTNEGIINAKYNFECASAIGGTVGRITSNDIDALTINSSAALILLDNNYLTIEEGDVIGYTYKYYNNEWSTCGHLRSLDAYKNQHILYFFGDITNVPRTVTNLYFGYVDEDSKITNSVNIDQGQIIYIAAIMQIDDSGIITLDSLIGSFLTYQSASWKPATLNSDITGSDIIFVPERPLALYAANTNLIDQYFDFCDVAGGVTISQNQYNITMDTINSISETISVGDKFPVLVNKFFLDGEPALNNTILGIAHLNGDATYPKVAGNSCYLACEDPLPIFNWGVPSETLPNIAINTLWRTTQDGYKFPSSGAVSHIDISDNSTQPSEILYYDTNTGLFYYYQCYYTTHEEGSHTYYTCVPLEITVHSELSSFVASITYPNQLLSNLCCTKIQSSKPYFYPLTNISAGERYALVSYRVQNITTISQTNKIYQLEGTILARTINPASYINHDNSLLYCFNKGSITLAGSTWILGRNITYSAPTLRLDNTNRFAFLNKNTTNITYLKPNNSLASKQYIVFNEVNVQPRLISEIDYIEYGAKFVPISTPDPVYSSVTNSMTKTPYKYQIKSYFKEGDYNPIYYGGSVGVGFVCLNEYSTFTIVNIVNPISFVLDNTTYRLSRCTNIAYTLADDNYSERIKVRGYYKQTVGRSWSYYRMALYSGAERPEVLLQDTGNIYQGDIQEEFFVPASESNYFVLLLVYDEIGNINVAAAKIAARGDELEVDMDVSYDYDGFINLELSNLIINQTYTIFRQEYGTLNYEIVEYFKATNTTQNIHDYNITNNRKYQYIIQNTNSIKTSSVVTSSGRCWSIVELLPTDLPDALLNSSAVKQKYTVDENNMWLFKYNGDFGSQTQNIAKSEQQTLGRYSRIGRGLKNNITGSITALLGQDIIPGTKIIDQSGTTIHGYQEQLRNATISSNNAIDLLKLWRSFVYSKNPKLLKDVKGQTWIVQVMSGQNTPMHHVEGQPDTISFSWTEIENTDNIIITYMPIV